MKKLYVLADVSVRGRYDECVTVALRGSASELERAFLKVRLWDLQPLRGGHIRRGKHPRFVLTPAGNWYKNSYRHTVTVQRQRHSKWTLIRPSELYAYTKRMESVY